MYRVAVFVVARLSTNRLNTQRDEQRLIRVSASAYASIITYHDWIGTSRTVLFVEIPQQTNKAGDLFGSAQMNFQI
jgi:hypothetical protein